MQFTTSVLALLATLSLTHAIPAPEAGMAVSVTSNGLSARSDGATLTKRGNAQATSWSGNNCAGSSAQFSASGSGSGRICWTIRGGSLLVTGSGCITRTWSGNNCGGSSFVVPDSSCHGVQFASVSFDC